MLLKLLLFYVTEVVSLVSEKSKRQASGVITHLVTYVGSVARCIISFQMTIEGKNEVLHVC